MRLNGFKNWVVESVLQKEATVKFGARYPNKDVNDVPPDFWQWLHKELVKKRYWVPAIEGDDGHNLSRDEVLDLVQKRANDQKYPSTHTPEPPPPTHTPNTANWILGRVVDVEDLKQGEFVVLTKGVHDEWVLMTRSGVTKRIPALQVRSAVISVRDPETNVPITSTNPEDLWNIADRDKEPEAQPEPGGTNPHILDRGKLSEEQKEIDKEFEQMMLSPRQNHMVIGARAGTGKAQPLDSRLLTPNGWIRMGDVKEGDMVFGSDGLPHKVIGVFPQGLKDVAEVEFTDNSKVECSEDHLWFTETKRDRDHCGTEKIPKFSYGKVTTTKELAKDLIYKKYPKHYVPVVKPINFENKKVDIDPYLMGILLGDGSFRTGCVSYSNKDDYIINSVNDLLPVPLVSRHVNKYDYRIVNSSGRKSNGRGKTNKIKNEIENLSLWMKDSSDKFIPDVYKFNDIESRISLLQGLMDTDGEVDSHSMCYPTVSKRLAKDVEYLVQSLGGIAKIRTKKTYFTYKGKKKQGKLCYRVWIKLPPEIEPFQLERKKQMFKPRTKYFPSKAIKSITNIGKKECQCISIDAKDNLYVTDNCVLTHNTTILKHLAWKYGKDGQSWLYLVFNSKNRAEAKEVSGGYRKFPDFVEIYTTNSFLGHVMGDTDNLGVMPLTDRISTLQEDDGEGKKLEKARLLVDGPDFQKLMTTTYHIPDWEDVKEKIVDILHDFGVPERRSKAVPGKRREKTYYEVCEDTVERTIDMIRHSFQERTLTLLGLLKSFSIDPRKKDIISKEVRRVFDKYDVANHEDGSVESGFFDTELESIKERISKYKPNFRTLILNVLEDLLHYDFMRKNYKEEIIGAATWLLEKSMPKATNQTYSSKKKGANREMKHNLGDYRDFNDDIWLPTIHADETTFPHYDVVLADEVQDFNEGQKIMLRKLAEKGAKIVAVGDVFQCHPAGTMISLTGGGQKTIENLKVGDELVTYNSKKNRFPGTKTQGRKVLEIACRPYKGSMITIETKSTSLDVTPNHRCLVKFPNDKNLRCLYLMMKGQSARVGICPIGYKDHLGVVGRAATEKADKIWILNIYQNKQLAQIAEIKTSLKFGIPQLVFFNNNNMTLSQELINETYMSFGDLTDNAKKCLAEFYREWEFPIWEKGKKERYGQLQQNYLSNCKTCMIQAANLTSGMAMRIFAQNENDGDWEPIVVSRNNTECDVYSLSVEPTELGRRLYIANDVVVGNSIYRFRGADNDAFDNLSKMLKDNSTDKESWKAKKLTLNFRSRPEVIDFSNENTHVKDLKAGKKFKDSDLPADVTKYKIKYDDVFNSISQERSKGSKIETAFIARTNEPLVNAALKLLGKGVPFAIIGKDVSGDLVKHIVKLVKEHEMNNNTSLMIFRDSLLAHEEHEVNKNSKYSTKKDYLSSLKDKTLALKSSIDQATEGGKNQNLTIGNFKDWLRTKLGNNTFDFDQSDEEKSEQDLKEFRDKMEREKPVVLTTSHKSKGLEFARVYILRNDQFPHPKEKHPEGKKQEENARYVAYTRAMHQLHILELEGQPGYKK